jgi:hypothetical protein
VRATPQSSRVKRGTADQGDAARENVRKAQCIVPPMSYGPTADAAEVAPHPLIM